MISLKFVANSYRLYGGFTRKLAGQMQAYHRATFIVLREFWHWFPNRNNLFSVCTWDQAFCGNYLNITKVNVQIFAFGI